MLSSSMTVVSRGDGVRICRSALAVIPGPGTGKFRAANEFTMRFLNEFRGAGQSALACAEQEPAVHFENLPGPRQRRSARAALLWRRRCPRLSLANALEALAFFGEPKRERRRRRAGHVVFEIADDLDAIRGRAECPNAVGVRGRLHQKGGSISKADTRNGRQVKAKQAKIFLVARERTVRDTPAGEYDRDIAFAGFAEEIGPDFSFENDDERGPHGVENPSNAEPPIEWEINHGVGEWHTFFRERVAGYGWSWIQQGDASDTLL